MKDLHLAKNAAAIEIARREAREEAAMLPVKKRPIRFTFGGIVVIVADVLLALFFLILVGLNLFVQSVPLWIYISFGLILVVGVLLLIPEFMLLASRP